MKRTRHLGAGLVLLAVLFAGAAYVIYFVSDAHGHGLASGDQHAITALIVAAGCSALGSAWCFRRGRG